MEGGPVSCQISFVSRLEFISFVPLRSFFHMTDIVSLIVGEGEGCGHRPGCQLAKEKAPRS